ncbi:hypothetical protein ACJO1Q_18315 [Vibrio parahaemolyticus]|uniref:hypothetical protein n=2 Tax=Vibrio parahaemolyticus TaxID=670 RepID=UPI00084B2FCF|nr:hypothetical protein [Vibrio parahaemolyticus]EJG0883445.1 hypothetical protein [Vibrio parahaemolyticus]ELI5445808.1 hypothetical protein [Vibrio parahaemolyticus]ODW55581.1 hypothetical protein BBL88_09840 [Vibrio parahaemolyticus]
MGSMKDELYDHQEELLYKEIAGKLGITEEELELLDWSIEQNCSDDGLLYGELINIEESSSDRNVYSKVVHLLNSGSWANLDDL